jgi:mannose-6-phosphate isomerase-like protein (cupin superfamily)
MINEYVVTFMERPMSRQIILCSFAILVASAHVGAQSARAPIDTCINTFNAAKVEPTKAGYQYWFADKNYLDGRTIKLSVVAPGNATHSPHSHAEDEFFFVLAGRAEFVMNGERRDVGPMTSLYCPPNSEHGIRNAGTVEVKYLVIKKYER